MSESDNFSSEPSRFTNSEGVNISEGNAASGKNKKIKLTLTLEGSLEGFEIVESLFSKGQMSGELGVSIETLRSLYFVYQLTPEEALQRIKNESDVRSTAKYTLVNSLNNISQYWSLIKLKPSGGYTVQTVNSARQLFQQQFPELELVALERLETGDHKRIQRQLFRLLEDAAAAQSRATAEPEPSQAEQCLRCYISHQILQVCIDLQTKFGQDYGFSLNDVLGSVLNDVDLAQSFLNAKEDTYRPFAVEILATFKPQVGSLSTWASMLTRLHPELNDFLLEHGIVQQGNWALLNEKTPDDLRRMLADVYNLPDSEIEQACTLLDSYHAVYRRDRRGSRGKCKPPTESQLEAIQRRSGLVLTPAAVLAKLVALADYLRQQWLLSKGVLPAVSMDDEDFGWVIESVVSPAGEARESGDQATNQELYNLVNDCLDQAIRTAISQRLDYLQRQSPDKAKTYLRVLRLYGCEQRSMAEIAPIVGLKAQFQVTRLLRIDDLLATIRRQLLEQLKASSSNLAQFGEAITGDLVDNFQNLDETCLAGIIEKPRANSSTSSASSQYFVQRFRSIIDEICNADDEF